MENITAFQRDLEVLINEGVFAAKGNRIRFIFRHPERFEADIKELDLSSRAYHCLKRGKYDHIKDIDRDWDNLSKIRNSGTKTVKEIRNRFLQWYYDTLSDEEKAEFWRDTVEATMNM